MHILHMTGVMESVQALLLVLVTVASLCPGCIAVEVQVLPDLASDCSSDNSGDHTLSAVNIDTALMNTSSNTTLLLENGCYHINSFTLLQGLSNIRLIGSGSESTIVKCEGDVGLAFVNISGLLISGMTITNCSLSGDNLQKAFGLVQESLDVFYSFRNGTIVGIFISDTSDLQTRNVIVRNTPGIGMVAINLMGESDMNNVTFTHNGIPGGVSCIGGGLYILYTNYRNHTPTMRPSLAISEALFNQNINNVANTRMDYTIGLAGGLGLILSQSNYPADVSITSTTF